MEPVAVQVRRLISDKRYCKEQNKKSERQRGRDEGREEGREERKKEKEKRLPHSTHNRL
jgi:hypothetical protein